MPPEETPVTVAVNTPSGGQDIIKRVDSLTDRAYHLLEEQIVTLQLKPGEVLSESSLAKSLGIGRTPIREALQRLAREGGLVEILPRRGILVSSINVGDQLELLRVRREIERLMCQLAAARSTTQGRARFRQLAAAMDNAAQRNDDVEFMRLDQQFNQLLAQTCRNKYARKSMGLMQGLSRRFWYQHYKQALDLPRCAKLHANCARAIADGDRGAVVSASDALIDYIEEFTRATLDVDTTMFV